MAHLAEDVPDEDLADSVAPGQRVLEPPLRTDQLLDVYEDSRGDVTALYSTGGVFLYVSPACEATLGWTPDDLVGRSVVDFVHPDDLPAVNAGRRAALRSSGIRVATGRFRCRDGGYLWTETVLRQIADPRDDAGVVLAASIRDIADRKLVEVRLQRQALTDPLTGIANRTVFMDRLEQGLKRLDRSETIVAVIYLDLDRFKVINDSLGHDVGDRLLMRVAERALGVIRPADTLARIGGDEFVVLAEGLASAEEAHALAARVCESMEVPFDLDGESIVCTTSAGVSTTTDAGYGAQALVQEADLALYRAKYRGRNRAEVFDEELRTTAIGRLAIERMIRSAIGDDRLCVQYQPIIDLTSGHVIRVEALVRIKADEGGLVLPDEFIDVAEETGLLVPIDEYVLSEATGQAATWARDLGFADFAGVAINVTARHLSDSRFGAMIEEQLVRNGLAADSVAIEVTERVLMEASNSAMDGLNTIREMGVPVGLDDFGTGYSSLAYLRQFPLDFLKIDRSFVHQLREGDENVAIVTAIIDLAHALGLWVVAEGVETDEQLATLVRLGCDHAQGFLFGRGEDPDTVSSVIARCAGLSAPAGA